MPAHWEPCPGKTIATLRPGLAGPVPVTARACGSCAATARRAATAAWTSAGSVTATATAARWANTVRRVARVRAVSGRGAAPGRSRWGGEPGGLVAQGAVGPAGQEQRVRSRRGAFGVLARFGRRVSGVPALLRTSGVRGSRPTSDGSSAAASGASSTRTCALVPLMPNEETPARRVRLPGGHGVLSPSGTTAPVSQSMRDEGASR